MQKLRLVFGCFLMMFIISLITECNGSGNIKIRFISYNNPKHRLSNGRCCEEGLETTCSRDPVTKRCVTCTQDCDSLFKIRLTQNFTSILYVNTSTLSYKDQFDFAKELTPNIPNPFIVNVYSYKGPFTLSVASFDDDDHLGIDPIDESKLEFDSDTILSNKSENLLTLSGMVSYINISIKVSCKQDYYGQHCDVFCQSNDDENGHFMCHQETGKIQCLYGWMDTKANCTVKASSVIQPSPSVLIVQSKHIESLTSPIYRTSQHVYNSVEVESKSIKASKSKQSPLQTSHVLCTYIRRTIFDLMLNAEITEDQLNTSVSAIICMDINKSCYNTNQQCSRSVSRYYISFDDISIQKLGMNATTTHLRLEIHSADGYCSPNFQTCVRTSILKSIQIRDLLNIEQITICQSNGTKCTHEIKSRNQVTKTKEESTETGLILGILFGLIGLILVIAALIYIKKKRLIKIDALEPEEKKTTPDQNEEDISNTSVC